LGVSFKAAGAKRHLKESFAGEIMKKADELLEACQSIKEKADDELRLQSLNVAYSMNAPPMSPTLMLIIVNSFYLLEEYRRSTKRFAVCKANLNAVVAIVFFFLSGRLCNRVLRDVDQAGCCGMIESRWMLAI
jgi:hypothetical protein